MRISDRQWLGQHANRLQNNRQALAKIQEKLVTGRSVNRPSDDPTTYNRLESLNHRLSGLDTFDRNGEAARRKLQTAESGLNEMLTVMLRVRESVITGLNGTINDDNRNDIAQELRVIRDHFVKLTQTRMDDQFVYSGTRSDTPPLTDAGVYQGGGDGAPVAIGDGAQLDLAIDGSEIFADDDGNVFELLEGIITDLEGSDLDGLGDRILQIDQAENRLISARTDLGARLRRVEVTQDLTADIRTQLSREYQNLGDTDFAAAISDMQAQEQALQAAVQIAGRTMTPSLLDVL